MVGKWVCTRVSTTSCCRCTAPVSAGVALSLVVNSIPFHTVVGVSVASTQLCTAWFDCVVKGWESPPPALAGIFVQNWWVATFSGKSRNLDKLKSSFKFNLFKFDFRFVVFFSIYAGVYLLPGFGK